MADAEWFYKFATNSGFAVLTGVMGLAGGLYGAGRRSAEREQSIKDGLRDEMVALKNEAESSKDELIEQFRESFAGLRQKINDVELDAQKRFVEKGDFKDFLEEYRENTHRIFDKLDQISDRKSGSSG